MTKQKTKMEIRSLPISLNSVSNDGKLNVSGLVNGAGSISEILQNPINGKQFRETIAKGVFARAISNSDRIDFLSMHDKDLILSTTDNDSLELRETDNGLEMNASITGTSWGKDTFQLIKDGIIKGMSFGMRVLNDTWSIASDNIPMRTINDIELFEVSAVRNPAYTSSEIEARDVDVIIDVEIPNNIEERRDILEETKEPEVREEEVIEDRDDEVAVDQDPEVREDDDEEERSEEEHEDVTDEPVTETLHTDEPIVTDTEEKQDDEVDVITASEVRNIENSLKSEITELRAIVDSLKTTINYKEEVRSVRISENRLFFEAR